MHKIIFRKLIKERIHNSAHRKTGIVCTIGMNNSKEFLGDLVTAGMNVMRVNCSHGDHKHHQRSVDNLRDHIATLKNRQRHVALMLDIRGPKIRTGMLEEKEVSYEPGDEFVIKVVPTKEIPHYRGNKKLVYCDYLSFPKTVKAGDRILIDDGLMEVACTGIGHDFINVVVKNKAVLCERKGVLLPGAIIDLPAVSEKDREDLKFAAKNHFDFVAASFIRRAEQVREVRHHLGPEGKDIKIVSKIENQEGLDNIDSIIQESDAVMVARGDLGTELPPEKIFSAQKMIIEKCNFASKPVITATQMLESMTYYPTPTRAECTDVANAILDGTDCVMLSGETAKGKYPIHTIKTMANICHEVEEHLDYEHVFLKLYDYTVRPFPTNELMASSAVKIAYETKAKLIFNVTETGQTARYLAKYRPPMPIISLTNSPVIARQSAMCRGVLPFLVDEVITNQNLEQYVKDSYNWCVENGFIQREVGDMVVVLHDTNPGDYSEDANDLRILKI